MISHQLTQELQHYVGKICTVITVPMALSLNPNSFPQWFTVRIDSIDQEAIWGTDPQRLTKQTYFLPVLAIVEEQTIEEDHPAYEEVKTELEKTIAKPTPPPKPETSIKPTDCISITSIEQQAAVLKEKFRDST